jgi:quercetin dioxygenase-like cupin family protein
VDDGSRGRSVAGARLVPIEIRRFGVGHRRPDGPPGTVGVTGQVIHSDERGLISELAFARGARVEPHVSPNTTWFVVIEGGGWVGVDSERTRVAAGEAVLLPPDVTRAAWTEHSQMRAFMIEFAGLDDPVGRGILDGIAVVLPAGSGDAAARGEGSLRDDPTAPVPHDPTAGEPV